ncbi:MAG TPA: hypothetical protein VF719_03690 [Abditibacteriaceae bacterium]|jgi:hypothetical protein
MSGELSTKQQKALDALLIAPTHEAAAEAAGVTTVTLWRYLKDETFVQAFRDIPAKDIVDTCGESNLFTF